jgi:MFS family permease
MFLLRIWIIFMGVCSPEIFMTSSHVSRHTLYLCYPRLESPVDPAISYNIGILTPVYVNPGFIKALNKPTSAQKGLITAIYYLGTWCSYIFIAHPLSDRLGRRYAALVGAGITCVGAAVMTGADGKTAFASMIVGRIIAGFGNAIISSSVPLYQRFVDGYTGNFARGPWLTNPAVKLPPRKRGVGLLL